MAGPLFLHIGSPKTATPALRRCCTSLTTKNSLRDSSPLHALHEQATSRPLSHDELVQLQRIAAQAVAPSDLGEQGHDLARAA